MSDSNLLSHYSKKQHWMASHIEQAQYPTQESKAGLSLYKASESTPLAFTAKENPNLSGLSFYDVDCHPLMVRYAKTLAQKWQGKERETVMEFLSQVSLTDLPAPEGQEVKLWLAMENGNPVATGMMFSSEESEGRMTGLYDVFGLTTEATEAMIYHLLAQSNAQTTVMSK